MNVWGTQTDESQKHYATWIKPDSKSMCGYDSNYFHSTKGKTIGKESRSSYQGQGVGGRILTTKEHRVNLLGDGAIFYLNSDGDFTAECFLLKLTKLYPRKRVNCL